MATKGRKVKGIYLTGPEYTAFQKYLKAHGIKNYTGNNVKEWQWKLRLSEGRPVALGMRRRK